MLRFGPTHFFKFHGTGNDFILVFQNDFQNYTKSQLAKKLCHRRFGIGADGLLIVRQQHPNYRMEIFNSDGSNANMCGNGLRCFSALLYKLKLVQNQFQVFTEDGMKNIKVQQPSLKGNVSDKIFQVSLFMGIGKEITEIQNTLINISEKKIYFTVIGVPHIVLFLTEKQFEQANFQAIGLKLKKLYDANINLCKIQNQKKMKVTTYQKGAGLTYSCGTGVSSSVYIGHMKKELNQVVIVQTKGGNLQISLKNKNQVSMKGPAKYICEGTFDL